MPRLVSSRRAGIPAGAPRPRPRGHRTRCVSRGQRLGRPAIGRGRLAAVERSRGRRGDDRRRVGIGRVRRALQRRAGERGSGRAGGRLRHVDRRHAHPQRRPGRRRQCSIRAGTSCSRTPPVSSPRWRMPPTPAGWRRPAAAIPRPAGRRRGRRRRRLGRDASNAFVEGTAAPAPAAGFEPRTTAGRHGRQPHRLEPEPGRLVAERRAQWLRTLLSPAVPGGSDPDRRRSGPDATATPVPDICTEPRPTADCRHRLTTPAAELLHRAAPPTPTPSPSRRRPTAEPVTDRRRDADTDRTAHSDSRPIADLPVRRPPAPTSSPGAVGVTVSTPADHLPTPGSVSVPVSERVAKHGRRRHRRRAHRRGGVARSRAWHRDGRAWTDRR